MKKLLGPLVAVCGFVIAVDPVLGESESRIWTDITGKHQIRARLVDVENDVVRLERPNGDISRIPLMKLSEKDQEFIRSGAAESPFETEKPAAKPAGPQGLKIGDRVEAEHFGEWQMATVTVIDYKWERVEVRIDGDDSRMDWTVDVDKMRYPGTDQKPLLIEPPGPESTLKSVRPNYDDMNRLVPDGDAKSSLTPDPLIPAKTTWKPHAVRLAASKDIFQETNDFTLSMAGSPLAMIITSHHGPSSGNPPQVELIDLTKGKSITQGIAPKGMGRLSMSPQGTKIASLPGGRDDDESKGRVDFWKVTGTKVDHIIGFAPYVMNTWPNLLPEWSAWLDEERFFTVNAEGQLILWQTDDAKAVYELLVKRNTKPVLSHSNKCLAIPTSSGVLMHDAATGKLLASVGSGDFHDAILAFSPSGKLLAAITNGFIDVIDITTGETIRSFPCNKATNVKQAAWVDENYLFLDSGALVHVPLRIVAWNYELPNGAKVKSFSNTFWVLMRDRVRGFQILAPLVLPPREALDAVAGLHESDILVVQPGEAVTLDVQITDDTFLAEDVKQALQTALTNAGMKLADDAKLKLVARTQHGETTEVHYRSVPSFRDKGETLSVTSRIYELELLLDGAIIWQRKAVHSAPHWLHMERGESTQDAVARVMKPKALNFSGRLPAFVVRPEFMEPLGSSKMSLDF